MLSPDQFFGKYDQKYIDFDGFYGFQCMDLYRQYVQECLGFPQSPPVASAKDVWNTYLTEYFDRIDNTIEAIPIKGDIIIWGEGAGTYGHIAVCKDGIQTEFTSFDQNWPVNSPCHFQKHNYNYVLGWLRAKVITQSTTTTTTQTTSTTSTTLTTHPSPDASGEVIELKNKLTAVYNIIWGKGWPWSKINRLKEILPRG